MRVTIFKTNYGTSNSTLQLLFLKNETVILESKQTFSILPNTIFKKHSYNLVKLACTVLN